MKTLKPLFLIIIAGILLSSCGSQQRITYLHDLDMENEQYQPAEKRDYTIRPGDLLYIEVKPIAREYQEVFASKTSGSQGLTTESMYYTAYLVEDDSTISLPLIGDINVGGQTIKEARKNIDQEISAYFNDYSLKVRFANFRFSVMGEVNSTGIITASQVRVNIFEALNMAGGVSYNANREDVILIRQQEGQEQIKHIDLTQKDILSNEDFYVLPGDIIYVKPLKRTVFREGTQDYLFFISATTSVVSTVILFISLFK